MPAPERGGGPGGSLRAKCLISGGNCVNWGPWFVFTSEGVGPTHDDVTMECVARGLKRKLIRHPAIESRIREFFKEKANEARLKMTEVREGAELIVAGRLSFATIKYENIYILPAIPEILEQRFQAIRNRFAASPYFLRVIYTKDGEGTVAEHLNTTLLAFPEAPPGLVPEIGDAEYAVKLTESKDEAYVEQAMAHLLGLLSRESVTRTE